jgi:hypothetical protein
MAAEPVIAPDRNARSGFVVKSTSLAPIPAGECGRSATRHHTTMKMTVSLFGLAIAAVLFLSGCAPPNSKSDTVAEGTIFSVEYEMEGGRTGGFTRLNESKAVPGGNGSWNIDAHGRLTRGFLLITRPQRTDLGPHVIPVHRLVSVQFGDGGIKQVNESQPKP